MKVTRSLRKFFASKPDDWTIHILKDSKPSWSEHWGCFKGWFFTFFSFTPSTKFGEAILNGLNPNRAELVNQDIEAQKKALAAGVEPYEGREPTDLEEPPAFTQGVPPEYPKFKVATQATSVDEPYGIKGETVSSYSLTDSKLAEKEQQAIADWTHPGDSSTSIVNETKPTAS